MLQITYGLLCAPDGCPIAIEVFDGDTADPMTLATQIEKLKQRFWLDRVVMVGDRGMITQARITNEIRSVGLDWITALRAPAIKGLLQSGALQLSLFDQRDMASITTPDFPDLGGVGERLVVCRNPDLAAERSRKREELLAATERDLARVQAAVARKRAPLRGAAKIALAVGAVVNRHKMAKHFEINISDTPFSFARKTAEIAAEAAIDGRAHQPTRSDLRRCDNRGQLQIPRAGGAGLLLPQDRRSAGPTSLSLAGESSARARAPLHASLLSRMAHAIAIGAFALARS